MIHRSAAIDALDTYIQLAMHQQSIPGLSLAVVQHGQLLTARGYGLANLEWDVPATPQTVYQIQSITKSFVAVGLMRLIQLNQVHLDDSISAYLSDLPPSWTPITIRQLLSMTSGIQNFIGDQASVEEIINFAQHTQSTQDVVAWAAARPLHFAPGTQYHYSPTNYHLLGLLIEHVTAQHWSAFLHDQIFAPLGMAQTRVVSWDAIIPHRAAGYVYLDTTLQNGYYMSPAIMASASGGLYSTALDLARWAVALAREEILTRAQLETMWAPVLGLGEKEAQAKESRHYGLGWEVQLYGGHRVVGHGGDHVTGFTTRFSYLPEDDLAVMILTNRLPADVQAMTNAVAALYLPDL